jgi:NADPH2 dehydrogenase
MGMDNPVPTFSTLVSRIRDEHPDLSYIHIVEPDEPGKQVGAVVRSNTFIRELWLPRPLIFANNFKRGTAIAVTQRDDGVLVAFARKFLANVGYPTILFAEKSRMTSLSVARPGCEAQG